MPHHAAISETMTLESEVQFLNASVFTLFKDVGIAMLVSPVQPSKALLPIVVRLVKYCNSLNEVIVVFPLNTSPKSVTAAASASLSSPSSLVSQLVIQSAFTLASANVITGLGTSTVISNEVSAIVTLSELLVTKMMSLKVAVPPSLSADAVSESVIISPSVPAIGVSENEVDINR